VWYAILCIVCSCGHVGPPRSISGLGYLRTCILAPGDWDCGEDGSQTSSASTVNVVAASFAPHISALSGSNRGVGSFIAQSPIAGMHGPQGSHRLMSGQPVGVESDTTPTPAAKRARHSPSVSPSTTAVEMASAWEHLVKPMTIEERFPDLDGCLLLEAIQNSYRDC
jgi:hypothetical protein